MREVMPNETSTWFLASSFPKIILETDLLQSVNALKLCQRDAIPLIMKRDWYRSSYSMDGIGSFEELWEKLK